MNKVERYSNWRSIEWPDGQFQQTPVMVSKATFTCRSCQGEP